MYIFNFNLAFGCLIFKFINLFYFYYSKKINLEYKNYIIFINIYTYMHMYMFI